jgi:hypothetical protein
MTETSAEFRAGQRSALAELAMTFRQITFISREDELQRVRVAEFIEDYAKETCGDANCSTCDRPVSWDGAHWTEGGGGQMCPPGFAVVHHVHQFKTEPSGYAVGYMKICECGESIHVG